MPAKDFYHTQVKNALIKDGWTITHDPFTMSYGHRDVFADLGAQRLLGAERGLEKIAVEIKTFRSPSELHDFEVALGQYIFYRTVLRLIDPSRKLYLAVPNRVYITTFDEPITRPVLAEEEIAIIAFDPQNEEITAWTN